MRRRRHRLSFQRGRLWAGARIGWDLVRTLAVPPRPDAVPALDPREHLVVLAGRAGGPSAVVDLRVVIWNIHRDYDPAGVERTLGRLRHEVDPHLLLLQEVPVSADNGTFWEREGVLELLAGCDLAWVPMHSVSTSTAYYPFRLSGQLTAARLPVEGVEALPLPAVSRRKLGRRHEVRRVALVTRHREGEGRLTVVNLHLENTARPSGRRLQLVEVLESVAGERGPVLLAGDLNTAWGPLEGALAEPARHGFAEVRLQGRRLGEGLDRAFVRGVGVASGRLLDLGGSDHRPLLVTVTLGAPGGFALGHPEQRA